MRPTEYEAQSGIVSVPLRAGLTVKIANLPADMTRKEAERVARILNALATPSPHMGDE
jgi:hypothetical protein